MNVASALSCITAAHLPYAPTHVEHARDPINLRTQLTMVMLTS